MDAERFLEQRRPIWQQLETLLQRAGSNVRSLSAAEMNELGRLYRIVTSDLALAQRDLPNQKVAVYLNQLVGRAHVTIYQGEPLGWRGILRFFLRSVPRLYRELLPYTTAAFVLFMLTGIAAFFVVWMLPDTIYVIEGPGIAGLVREVEDGKLWTEISPGARSAASSLILTNNIQVMFLTFAGGLTGGLLTLWVVISNGLHLGAIFGLLQVHGLSGGLGEFVLAHGFIELSVIFLAGGCGFYIGDALIRPGLHSRRESLTLAAQKAVRLIIGSVPLLIVAGLIEGFISPSGLPWLVKLAVGLGTGIALHWYWLRLGRNGEEEVITKK